MYASVVVDTGPTSSIESLTYEIPDGLAGKVEVGACVLVPLATRQAIGYVTGLEEESPVANTRPIIAELDSPVRLTEDILEIARWIADQYLCPLPRAVAAMLPGVTQARVQAQVKINDPPVDSSSLTPGESEILELIRSSEGICNVDNLYGSGISPWSSERCAGWNRRAPLSGFGAWFHRAVSRV